MPPRANAMRLPTAGVPAPGASAATATAQPGPAVAAPADPVARLDEKVRSATMAGRVSFLPYLDPYTEETSAMRRMYPMMLRNPVVKQSLQHKVHSVASLDLLVVPAAETERDHEVSDFVRYALADALEGSFPALAEEMLFPALIWKSVVAEKVWYPELWGRGKFAGKRFYRAVKSKEQAEPLYDEFRNITGIRATGYGQAVTFDPADFLIFKNWPLFGGPGMSDLRAAYSYLWQLDTVEKLHLIHQEKFLSPMMVATYDETFNHVADGPQLEKDMAAMRARSWIKIPRSVQIAALQLATHGDAEFLDKCKDLREQITLSITGAYLQMLTATSGGDIRGNSRVQQSTSELLVWELAARLAGVVNTQFVPSIVRENYGGVDYPKAVLGGISYQELLQAIQIDSKAQQMGAKLSARAVARKYSLQLAADPADELVPIKPAAPDLGGMGGGMPGQGFDDPPPPDPDGGEPRSFCGGPGSGRPGPCPEGGDERYSHATTVEAGRLVEAIQSHPAAAAVNAAGKAAVAAVTDASRGPRERLAAFKAARDSAAAQVHAALAPHAAAAVAELGERYAKSVHGVARAMAQRVAQAMTDEYAQRRARINDYLQHGYPQEAAAKAAGIRPDYNDYIGALDSAVGDRPALDKPEIRRVLDKHFLGHERSDALHHAHTGVYDFTRPHPMPDAVKLAHGVPVGEPRTFTDPAVARRGRRQRRRKRRRFALNVNALLLGTSSFDDPPPGPAPEQIALHGADGARAEQLLARAKVRGAAVLAALARRAVVRLVRAAAGTAKPGALFTPTEQRRLGHALAATIGTAHLLGAARIWRRADQAERHSDPAQRFSDVPTDLRCFDETGTGGIEPMPPTEAVDYFRRLVPGLDVDAETFAATIGREAFTLAVTTDKTLLDRVQGIIAERVATGQRVGAAAGEVQAILEAAGVAPANPQYSEMVVRTGMMESYNAGAQRELAGLADIFPVWEYANPGDSRSRPEHAARAGKYWPAARHFTDVRGTDPGDVCNCRCTFVPIDGREWADLQASGARAEDE